MSPSNPLQALRDLDRTSPHFHNQLIDLLHGNEYRGVITTLKGGGLAWLVNYLDNVSLHDVSPHPALTLVQVLCEISDPSSVPFREPLDELKRICGVRNVLPKACTLSDSLLGCVYEGTFNSSKVRIRRVRTHPKGDPQKVMEVCTPRHVFPLRALTDPTDISPGDCGLETFGAPKHCSPSGCYSRSTPTDLRSNARWGSDRVHHESPRHGQDKPRE